MVLPLIMGLMPYGKGENIAAFTEKEEGEVICLLANNVVLRYLKM